MELCQCEKLAKLQITNAAEHKDSGTCPFTSLTLRSLPALLEDFGRLRREILEHGDEGKHERHVAEKYHLDCAIFLKLENVKFELVHSRLSFSAWCCGRNHTSKRNFESSAGVHS